MEIDLWKIQEILYYLCLLCQEDQRCRSCKHRYPNPILDYLSECMEEAYYLEIEKETCINFQVG
jgi:hypothetical protein